MRSKSLYERELEAHLHNLQQAKTMYNSGLLSKAKYNQFLVRNKKDIKYLRQFVYYKKG